MENKKGDKVKIKKETEERDIMKGLENKFVISYIDSFYKFPNVYIVMEYCEVVLFLFVI